MADEPKKKSKAPLIILGIVLLIGVAAGMIWMFSKSGGAAKTTTTTNTTAQENSNSGLGGILGSLNLSGLHIGF